MKYKYTGIQLSQAYGGYDHDEVCEDLLAQKEDRKECKHKYSSETCKCVYCGKKITSGTNGNYLGNNNSTPSPLEGFEEIKEISDKDLAGSSHAVIKIAYKVNSLISNQKKLYQYIKKL